MWTFGCVQTCHFIVRPAVPLQIVGPRPHSSLHTADLGKNWAALMLPLRRRLIEPRRRDVMSVCHVIADGKLDPLVSDKNLVTSFPWTY